MRTNTLLVTAALFVAGCAGALAQGPGPGGGGFGGPAGRPMLGRAFRNLDLSEEQKAEIKKIMAAERSVMQPVREQLRENREALQAATKDGQFNEAEVTKLAQQQGDLLAQMIVSRERVQAQIWQVLTPEQREKLGQWRGKVQELLGAEAGPMRLGRGPRRGR